MKSVSKQTKWTVKSAKKKPAQKAIKANYEFICNSIGIPSFQDITMNSISLCYNVYLIVYMFNDDSLQSYNIRTV